MAADRENQVLRRKAQAAREQLEARVMSAPRALRLALERSADEVLQNPLMVAGTDRFTADPASLPEMVPEGALVLLLQGPQDATGALIMDPGIAAAVVEVQTTGTIGAGEAASRPLTRIDAALSAPLIDAVLDRFASNLADGPDAYWSSGFASGAMLDTPRSLPIALTAARYHVFRVALRVGQAGREGTVLMALPVPEQPALREDASPGAVAPDPRWQVRILGTHIRLDAVLCRIEMPLSQVLALRQGDVLPIAQDALRDVRLEAGARRPAARARLGQMGGRRALRLTVVAPQGAAETPQGDWVSTGFSAPVEAPDEEAPLQSEYTTAFLPEDANDPPLEDEMPAGMEAAPPLDELDDVNDSDRISDEELEALTRTV